MELFLGVIHTILEGYLPYKRQLLECGRHIEILPLPWEYIFSDKFNGKQC
jgi:hypothetical protein